MSTVGPEALDERALAVGVRVELRLTLPPGDRFAVA